MPLKLLNTLRACENTNPEKVAITVLCDRGVTTEYNYRQLNRKIDDFAYHLMSCGVIAGDIVMLFGLNLNQMVIYLLAAFRIGAVPSIVPGRLSIQNASSIASLLKDISKVCDAKFIVSTNTYKNSEALSRLDDVKVILAEVSECEGSSSRRFLDLPPLNLRDSEPAYIQFTSGSTGPKKGVVLSIGAIDRFIQRFANRLEISQSDRVLNWLPLYHDFGLVAGLLVPISLGCSSYLMTPIAFMRRTKQFLNLIRDQRLTIVWMINFAMRHVSKYISKYPGKIFDLSSIRIIGTGGEPVQLETCAEFFESMDQFGLSEDRLVCGYGMAENTLAVTVTDLGCGVKRDIVDRRILRLESKAQPLSEINSQSSEIVSCGRALTGTTISILSDKDTSLGQREVGEIAVSSDSLFTCYAGNSDLTAERLKNHRYRTGDIGYLAGDELFVIGRVDDMINIGGEKILPDEIERAISLVPSIESDEVVSFGISDEETGTSKIVVIACLAQNVNETDRQLVAKRILKQVKATVGVVPGTVVFCQKGWIVRATNGKIARIPTKDKYLHSERRDL